MDVEQICPASADDAPALWPIFQEVIADGTTYVQDETTTMNDFRAYWFERGGVQWMALDGARALGGYTLRANYAGRGAHIATASYIVSTAARGRGLGRRLGEHSLQEARRLGFRGMQFNFVVSGNLAAVRLWQSLGFDIVGKLPGVFRHPTDGFVDACVMFLSLTPPTV